MMQFKREYGHFDQEANGRQSGIRLVIGFQHKDGRYPVAHIYGSTGRHINKLYTEDQLVEQIAKLGEQP